MMCYSSKNKNYWNDKDVISTKYHILWVVKYTEKSLLDFKNTIIVYRIKLMYLREEFNKIMNNVFDKSLIITQVSKIKTYYLYEE